MRRVSQIRISCLPALVLGFCLLLLFPLTAKAETLRDMEAILDRYPTLQAFLDDKNAVLEYRESLKSYLDDDSSFNEVFEKFIHQVKGLARKAPAFAEQAWKKNPNWENERFTIKGDFNGTGLDVKRERLLGAIADIKKEAYEQGVAPLLKTAPSEKQAVKQLSETILTQYGILSPEAVALLPRKAQDKYQHRLGTLAASPEAKLLASYVVHKLLEHDEGLGDALHSADADITALTLRELSRPSKRKAAIDKLDLGIPEEELNKLVFSSPNHSTILHYYDRAVESIKKFRHIPDPRMTPELFQAIQQANAANPQDIYHHLGKYQPAYDDWRLEMENTRTAKKEHAYWHNSVNPFFKYDLLEDPARGTLRLKGQSGLELSFIPTPRPFHAFMSGRKTGECVGGRDAQELTPRRWARAAMNGAQTFFTESGNGKMEGAMGLTPLRHSQDGKEFDVVDIMSNAIKGDIAVKSPSGRIVKFSFFDRFVDLLSTINPDKRLVISDGNSVSQNVGGSEVVNHSPAYLENQIVGKPSDFAPIDPLAIKINELHPHGMYPGGIIYDGMKDDGTKVVRLVPSVEQKKWSKEELEDAVYEKLYAHHTTPKSPSFYDEAEETHKKPVGGLADDDIIWKRAVLNGISLHRASEYHAKLLQQLQSVDKVLSYLGEPSPEQDPQDLLTEHLVNPRSASDWSTLRATALHLGKIKLSAKNSEKIASHLRTASFSNKNLHLLYAFHHTDPNGIAVIDFLKRKITETDPAGLHETSEFYDEHIRNLIFNFKSLYGEPYQDWMGVYFERLLELTSAFETRFPTNEAGQKNAYRDRFLRGMKQFNGKLLNEANFRMLLKLTPDESFVSSQTKMIELGDTVLRHSPQALNELIEQSLQQGFFGSLREIAEYLEQNPNLLDPRKRELLKPLMKPTRTRWRKTLGFIDALSARLIPDRVEFDLDTFYFFQQVREENARIKKLKRRWENLKQDRTSYPTTEFLYSCRSALRDLSRLGNVNNLD